MPSSTFANRTTSVSLTGTPTQVAWPAAYPAPCEVWASGTADWTFRFAAADAGFPVPAGVLVRLPTSSRTLLVAGSGTLSLAVFGDAT